MTGTDVSSKPINLLQLEGELTAASVSTNGLGMVGPSDADATIWLVTYDGSGLAVDLPSGAQPVIDAHQAMRDKTDAEYSTEFQAAGTTAARKQEIRDIMNGLLPREQVPM